MGYDIDITHNGESIDMLYMTYNHAQLFIKYNIYPRDFNGKTVAEIIPAYLEAKKVLESVGVSGNIYTDASTDRKYSDSKLYEANDDVILYVVKDTLSVLCSCPDSATWHSD
jgi:hypothetical protein